MELYTRWALSQVVTRLLDEITENIVDVTFGGAPLCAGPTPRQRGPPPLKTGRGGRLPTLLAAEGRPLFLVTAHTALGYRYVLIAPLTIVEVGTW